MPEEKVKLSRLLRIREAARLLGLHPTTLRRWDREGKLKAVRIGSRIHPSNPHAVGDRRYRKEDIEKLMRS